jgi:hypothetical protein
MEAVSKAIMGAIYTRDLMVTDLLGFALVVNVAAINACGECHTS